MPFFPCHRNKLGDAERARSLRVREPCPDVEVVGAPNPMPPDVANHVAAVALFGKPTDRFMRAINQPSVEVGPLYAARPSICASPTT